MDESIPWSKNGWRGYITDYKKPGAKFIGLLTLRCQKGSRWIVREAVTAEYIEFFDPDDWWRTEGVSRATRPTVRKR